MFLTNMPLGISKTILKQGSWLSGPNMFYETHLS